MDTAQAVTHVGLCAGYGGIELGLKRAVPDLRTVALCEIEAFAVANLVAKMEAGLMDPAPVWPNLKTFPWGAFRDRVDILTGGYPCQPFSAAGQRKGKQDPRHLWPWIADGIRLLRPRICFFENVEGHISLGLSDVIEDLAGMGYRTTWGIFSASEVGAPHQRKRVFILAHRAELRGKIGYLAGQKSTRETGHVVPRSQIVADDISTGLEGLTGHGDGSGESRRISEGQDRPVGKSSLCCWPSRPGEQQYGWEPPRVVGDQGRQLDDSGSDGHGKNDAVQAGRESIVDAGTELGDTSCEQDRGLQQPGVQADAASAGHGMADTISGWGQQAGSQCGSSKVAADSRCQESAGHQQAVISDDQGSNGVIRQAQPTLGGDSDGPPNRLDYAELCVSCDNRTDELRLLGNGVVPATAHRAFCTLIKELDDDEAGR